MQIFPYFCTVKRKIVIGCVFCALSLWAEPLTSNLSDALILDIYNAATEMGEVDFEQLQHDLYAVHESPIDLNHTSEEELGQLYFLSPKQIDDILLYADRHPFESLYELRMIPSLTDYEIRDLLPFVRVSGRAPEHKLYAREVFAQAHHEVLARVDARDIENHKTADPMYVQGRYRFDYRRRVVFGAQLRRPTGGSAQEMQWGAYVQLRDVAPHLHTVVGGNFQASFGQGLVLAPVFHSGKSMYVTSVGQPREALRYYSSADGEGLHGAGATMRWEWGKQTRLDMTALYSLSHYNDTVWRHVAGANMTLRHKRLEVQLSAIGNIWSDSIHPYRNAKYNRRYFRGSKQAVIGASVRYHYGWFDAFAEVAAAQNGKWGVGLLAGSRFYPTSGVALIALYRYYSPWFDNQLGYAFSETSRINDENGGYLGFEVTRLKNWKFSGYGDVFYFSGYKYGLGNDTCTVGFDAVADVQYIRSDWWLNLRARARKKGSDRTYSARCMFNWQRGGWSLRTTADANYAASYGLSIAQDAAYSFTAVPLTLRVRLQGFDARQWANRIYLYEHDVLYGFSIPATYGLGGRIYLMLRWQIIPQLALYLRASETVYARSWAEEHDRSRTRTDVHLLLRAKL